MQQLLNSFQKNSFQMIILSYFLLEFFTTAYVYFVSSESVRIVGCFKLILLGVLLLNAKQIGKQKKLTYAILALVLLYTINQGFFNPTFLNEMPFHISKGSYYYLIRFLSIFIFIVGYNSWDSLKRNTVKIVQFIERVLIFNTIFMVLGAIFQIELFNSYRILRFGYDGLFNKVNEVSYFYIILLVSLYFKLITQKKNQQKNRLLFFYVASVSLLLGTKTILLFLGLLLLFHTAVIAQQAKLFRKLLVVPFLFFVIFFKEIIQYCFHLFPFWKMLSEKYSLITLLFSTRDLAFYRLLNYFETNWNWVNYFIGGPYYAPNFHRSEMDIFDLFIFFGGVGLVVYLYCIGNYFLEKKNILRNTLVIIVFICGFLGGGLLLSMLSVIYLFLVAQMMQKESKLIN